MLMKFENKAHTIYLIFTQKVKGLQIANWL